MTSFPRLVRRISAEVFVEIVDLEGAIPPGARYSTAFISQITRDPAKPPASRLVWRLRNGLFRLMLGSLVLTTISTAVVPFER